MKKHEKEFYGATGLDSTRFIKFQAAGRKQKMRFSMGCKLQKIKILKVDACPANTTNDTTVGMCVTHHHGDLHLLAVS